MVKGALYQVWQDTQGDEPEEESKRWMEANECFYLFHPQQDWSRADAREFAKAAWNFLDLANA